MEHSILVPEVCLPQGCSLGDALSSWLASMPWDLWWTITTRNARKDSLAFIRDITSRIRHLGGTAAFIACEPFKLSHNLHAHGLLRNQTLVERRNGSPGLPLATYDFWDEFFRSFGRSRVEPINSVKDTSAYCTKYVTKLTDGDNWALWSLSVAPGSMAERAYPEPTPAPPKYNYVTVEDYNEFDRLLRERYMRPLTGGV